MPFRILSSNPPAQARFPAEARHPQRRPSGTRWFRIPAGLALAAALAGAQSTPNPCRSIHGDVLTAPPDANRQMEMRQQSARENPASFAAANMERKKQIAEDSARLLKLAAELKTEVDKTTKDTLSLGVIRKADEIEKLAHTVKEKMKLSAGQG